jgi:hypothetical protein
LVYQTSLTGNLLQVRFSAADLGLTNTPVPLVGDTLIQRAGEVLRVDIKVTTNQLAERLGVSPTTAWRAKRGYMAQRQQNGAE